MSRSDVHLTITLPTEEEVQEVILHADVVALVELDQRIRDSMPIGQEMSRDTALAATELLGRILRALSAITLCDGRPGPPGPVQNQSPGQRAQEVKKALKVTHRGQIDTEALARAAAVKARMRGH